MLDLPEAERIARLVPAAAPLPMVLDTDTYNEIDDQFAVVYALLSPDQMAVEAIYAAPFFNRRSTSAADGMERSYEEILRLLERLPRAPRDGTLRGSRQFLGSVTDAQESPAARDLIERSRDRLLFVVAIGALTNVASALLLDPSLAERIAVVWLGGQPSVALSGEPTAREFNLEQDPNAARVVLDSGVPLLRLPCEGVTSHLSTTLPEIERYVGGQGPIGDYLQQIFVDYQPRSNAPGYAKTIWDIAGIAALLDRGWLELAEVATPVLTDELSWKQQPGRHHSLEASFVRRVPIFADLFAKLAAAAS